MITDDKALALFWLKVNKLSGIDACWLWTGTVLPDGYGAFSIRRRTLKLHEQHRAHRYSWFIHFGELGTWWVLHRCDTPLCVRPTHLFLGTVQDNSNDKVNKQRQPRGESHGRRKLTETEAQSILDSKIDKKLLPKIYGVHRVTIFDIQNRKTWKHLQPTTKKSKYV